jgi:uncharacterized membrane protein
MIGAIVFAMGFLIVVLICALAHNMAERFHNERIALASKLELERLLKTLDAQSDELCDLKSEIDDLRRKHEDYEKMAAEIKSAIARHKPITDDEIPF